MRAQGYWLAVTAGAVLALDRATKWAVVEGLNLAEVLRIEVAPPYLVFQMAWNRGINFGLFGSGSDAARWFLVALAVAISAGLSVWVLRGAAGRRAAVAVGAIVGGALGNAWDRIGYGAVADFLNMSCCGIDNPYAFNVADTAIFAGALALLLLPTPRADDG
ncbi:signal peptidase II [Rhodobacteraceae bacterium 2CG4]|uniref:Lipoprotein signal peptidase n=1 Tax=Halovulum marinum TaxID=2662447 RepID=A0A6L5Z5N4_9RHOB|nr:signal peptidase II [Halovulum marinum]MSU91354.1 signal peptidase II [Halovulum marinum]